MNFSTFDVVHLAPLQVFLVIPLSTIGIPIGSPWFVVPQESPGIAPAGLVLRRERFRRRKEALAERDADGGGAAAATHGRNGRSGGE